MAMQFDLVDLRLVVNIADTNSMSKGAELSHISPPAASIRIKNLERDIGVPLFYRTVQGVTLTPAGQCVVQHATAVQQQVHQLSCDLQEFVSGAKGHLRIFALTTAAFEYLSPILRKYLPKHPNVSVDVREGLSVEIVRAVMDGRADIGIVAGPVRTEDLETIPYRRDRMVAIVPDGHPLSKLPTVTFMDTLEYDHVGLQESSALHAFLQQASFQLHRRFNLRVQVSSFESACRMVESGIGVAIVPEATAQHHAKMMAITTVRLSDAWTERHMKICVRDLNALPNFGRALVELLIENAQAQNIESSD